MLEKLKNIFPFLSNVDFDNPQTKRNVIMISIAGVLFLILILVSTFKPSKKTADKTEQTPAVSSLEIQQGENNDILGERSTMDARDRRRQRTDRSLEDIFSDIDDSNDPMAFLSGDENGKAGQASNGVDLSRMQDIIEGKEVPQNDNAEFGRDLFPGETPVSSSRSNTDTPRPPTTPRTANTAQQRVDARKKQIEEQQAAISKQASSNSSGSSGSARSGSSAQAEYSGGSRQQEPAASGTSSSADVPASTPSEPAPGAKVSVRKSGEISSLASSRGRSSVGGLVSLKNKDVYVSEESEHLFKVMFARDEKVTSGQRVSLRLLEDMVIDGILVPTNTLVSAIVSIGDRLGVSVNSIELNGKIYALNYEGYDTDGAKGLYCPRTQSQNTTEEAKRQGRSIGTGLLSSRLGSVAGMAVSAGVSIVENAKGQQTINVTSGYTFFLRKRQER